MWTALSRLLVSCMVTAILAGTSTPETLLPAQEHATVPSVAGYILVQTSTQSGWLPLAAAGESYDFPLVQTDWQGNQYINLLHVTDGGLWVAEANCDSQDCVHQGEVTLENKDTRLLGGMIICLPHQVSLTLYSLDEVRAMMNNPS